MNTLLETITIEEAPRHLQDRILLDDWLAFYTYHLGADYLYLVLRKFNKQYVVHLYNNLTGGYAYGDYFHQYDVAFKRLKERAKYSGYNLSQLIQIEGEYGDE